METFKFTPERVPLNARQRDIMSRAFHRYRETTSLPPQRLRLVLRGLAGLTRREAAAFVGCSPQALQLWESESPGSIDPGPTYLSRYRKLLALLAHEVGRHSLDVIASYPEEAKDLYERDGPHTETE